MSPGKRKEKKKLSFTKNVFGELAPKTWLCEFWSKNHTKTALKHPKIIEHFKEEKIWNIVPGMTFYMLSVFNVQTF